MSKRIVVLDTDILIMGAVIKRFDLLEKCQKYRFQTTMVNLDELIKERSRSPVKEAITRGFLEVLPVDDPREVEFFAVLRRRAGKGEAAAMAVAAAQRGLVGTHDQKARRIAQSLNPSIGTSSLEALMVSAVASGLLERAEIEDMVKNLVQHNQMGVFADGIPLDLKKSDLQASSSEV